MEENNSDDENDIPPPPRIKNFKGAVQALEDVQTFLESRGCVDSANTTSLLVNDIASNYVSNLKQSTLDQFMKEP